MRVTTPHETTHPPVDATAAPAPIEVDLQCPECDYNLTGAADRCPWCGWEIDVEALARSGGGKRGAVIAVALAASFAAMGAAVLLFDFGPGLRWRDAAACIAVALGAAGLLALAAAAVWSGGVWPMRRGEVSAILLVVGLISMAAGVTGATQVLGLAPTPLFTPTGVQVNGIFEFALTGAFFCLPGLALLALRLVSLRPRRKAAAGTTNKSPVAAAIEQAAFLVQWVGAVQREQVEVAYAESPRPTHPQIERLIAESWESAEALARTENRLLYNGPLIRLVRFEHQGDRLLLNVGPTCYRDFVGTHFHNAGLVRATDASAFAHALGISVLPATRDGQLVLGKRSTRVAYHGGWLHPFGGMVEPADRTPAGKVDVFAAARREACEELAILPNHICALTLIALVRDGDLWQPELIFEAALAQSARELAKGFDRHAPDGEHDALEFLNDDPESIAAFLHAQMRLTPVGQAALLTHGRHHFGVEWYDQTCLLLYGNLPAALVNV